MSDDNKFLDLLDDDEPIEEEDEKKKKKKKKKVDRIDLIDWDDDE